MKFVVIPSHWSNQLWYHMIQPVFSTTSDSMQENFFFVFVLFKHEGNNGPTFKWHNLMTNTTHADQATKNNESDTSTSGN